MLIITVQIFSLCYQIFPCVRTKFPVFSLSGKSKNQIPCFPCAVATLKYYSASQMQQTAGMKTIEKNYKKGKAAPEMQHRAGISLRATKVKLFTP